MGVAYQEWVVSAGEFQVLWVAVGAVGWDDGG
jgi:hypothetical protein